MTLRMSALAAALALSGTALGQTTTPNPASTAPTPSQPDAAPSRTGSKHPGYRPLSSFPKGKTAPTPADRAAPYVVPAHPPAPSGDDGSIAGKSTPD